MGKFIYTFTVVATLVTIYTKLTSGQAIRFTLNGVNYTDGSTVLRDDIGEEDAALHCTTNRPNCCRSADGQAAGQFYFPGNTLVPRSDNDLTRTYYRNRIARAIRLNRRPNGVITGQFRCEIPDANGTLVNLFINIVDITVSIIASDTITAGETYSLECTATVTGSSDQPTISWLHGGGEISSPNSTRMVSPTNMESDGSYVSTLTFNPLSASHAGTYTCRATVGGAVQNATEAVTVRNPDVTVSIVASVTTQEVGSVYSLTCNISGAERLTNSTITYQWFKDGDMVSNQTVGTLSFTSLSFSDAGNYTCQATVMSSLLSGPIDTSQSSIFSINPIVDIMVSITTSGTNTAGETYSLECSATVPGSTDQPTITWLDPMNNQVPSEMVTTNGSMSTLRFSPLSASHAGTYTCRGIVEGAMETMFYNITVKAPDPNSVNVASDPVSPVRPVGSAVNLTCTVELDPAVDVPVTVNTVWTGPAGFMRNTTTQRAMGSNTTYTSTAMVSSFGRNQSGVYTCTATVGSTSFIIGSGPISGTATVTVGVYLSLNGMILIANSSILITDIGTSDQPPPLVCTTDRMPCCQDSPQYGDWKFPDGSQVLQINDRAVAFHRNRDNNGNINLFRNSSDVISPTGRFCCEVEDVTNRNQTMCANIININNSITTSGTNTAGETYSLECSATVTGSTDQPTITWLDPMNNAVPSEMVTTTGSMSTLTFNPLTDSHAGTYTCRATVGNATEMKKTTISVNNPNITVIVGGIGTPTEGETYSLSCTVFGADGFNVTYQWQRNSSNLGNETGSVLVFSILRLSDAGRYSCQVTVSSTLFSEDIVVSSNPFEATFLSNETTTGASTTTEAPSESLTTITDMPVTSTEAEPVDVNTTAEVVFTEEQAPTTEAPMIISVIITPSSDTITAGQTYSLECTTTVIGSTDQPTITWLHGGDEISLSNSTRMVSPTKIEPDGSYLSTLTFNPLSASHAGTYTCRVMARGAMETMSFNLTVKASEPTVVVTSDPATPVWPVGSDVTLTCTVELSPAVDVPVTVNTVWTGPNGFATVNNVSQPVMGSTTTYTSTVMVSSFGRDQSGNYTCTATVSSTTSFTTDSDPKSGMARVTVGVYLSLKGVVYPNSSVIRITEIEQTNISANNGLQCITDRMPCCATEPNRAGEWFFPDRGMVPTRGGAMTFYRNRGPEDNGTVNLNRLNNNVMTPTGRFCCMVPDATDAVQTLCVNIVSIGVMITDSGSLLAGQAYSLECSVSGTSDSATFQWLKGSTDNRTQLTSDGSRTINSNSSVSQLRFSSLRASHGGRYTCQATVMGVVVERSANVLVDLTLPLTVNVPTPVGTIIAGSSPNLTCIVELNPAVDIPVTVNTVWTGPASTTVTSTSSLMESLTRYVITAMVDAARNGSYTCQATVSSSSQFITGDGTMSGSTTIIVGSLSPPNLMVSLSSPATSISLTWDQPQGAGAVVGYEINYSFQIIECGNTVPITPVVVILNNGSQRSYTIMNSSTTPVEENSRYTISITAVNRVGRSAPSMTASTTTAQAAPSAIQSLRTSSVNVTNITIEWDRLDCQDRNGPTVGYRLVYTSSDAVTHAEIISGTGDSDRLFTVSGLPPRSSYIFQVQATNAVLDVRGAAARLNVSTTAPQDFGFLLAGQLYPNNSVVTLNDIGSRFIGPALYCLTPSTECCSSSETPNEATVIREWYLPDGKQLSSGGTTFSREQVSSAVSLYRNGGTSPTGVFRCEVPDASGNSQNIYVGIYPTTDGSPSITSVLFNRNTTTLTCTSTGGPPTTVTWKKNGVLVNDSLYQQSQRVVDAVNATYENTLFNADVANFVGMFTCEVSNARDSAQETMELNGVSIILDQFTVGQSATAKCFSDVLATRMEWLTNGTVVESAASTQQLDLLFSLVNDSIHDQVYTCRVTREVDGMTATQNFTVNVDVPPSVVTATVSRSGTARAGMVYNLTCTVSKTVGGLANSPTASWTTGGVAVSSGNDIVISGSVGDRSAVSTLTFEPLRTSHEDRYICEGTLTSPALEMAHAPTTAEPLRVQISTPDITITVPPGPLYAGRTTPLTLTCTISLNSATDTDVSVTNMDVAWLNRSTTLSNSDVRVTISPPTGSEQPFTSTLTLSPLSTFDNTSFTCRARARPPAGTQTFVTDSEFGERTVSVIVESPLPPTVSIVHSSLSVMAGESLTLTCSASVQEGITGSAALTWTRGGAEQSDEPTLTFDSLLTSHGGVYTCTARLTIPEAGVDVAGTNTTNVVVLIPPPLLTISGSPRNTSFFLGLDVTFTCSITLNTAVDTPVRVLGMWNRNGTELVNGADSGRITVSNPPMERPPYQTTVRFNTLNNVTDPGTYECTATVTPQNDTFITGATSSISRTITVAGFPTQMVDPITDEGTSTAGFSGYTLICNTSKEPLLPSTSTLAVQWLDPRGSVIVNGTNFTISGSGPTTDTVLTSRLTFNSLYTSQAGEYTCRTLQTIPGIVTDHPEPVTFTVAVKLPAPLSLSLSRSRNTTLNAGTNFSLSCLISPNMTGVDTNVSVQSDIAGPGTSDANRISISQPMPVRGGAYETVVTFRRLFESDSGSYNCSARLTSSQQSVTTSDSVFAVEAIDIEALQPPEVSVSPSPVTTAGEQHMLTCTATVEKYLQGTPTLTWRLPGNTDDTSIATQSTVGTASNIVLSFSPLRTSHGGVYVCEATVNITGIAPRSQTANRTVLVQIPAPSIAIRDHLTPYNGTNFTLTGEVMLDQSVDTDVTVSGVWSSDGRPQETMSPPYLSHLTFEPLATNSSRDYTLTVTVRPSDGSTFIVRNNGSRSYSLNVAALPSRPPTITVASRRPFPVDGCGETMTLNCTANQVENLFVPPVITWRDSNGEEVPTGQDGNPKIDRETRQLIFMDITSSNQGRYTCQSVVNIPQAQIVNYIDMDTTQVNTNFPGVVQDLICAKSSSPTELRFSWELPVELRNEVVSYRVDVKELRHRSGTRDVVQFDVAGFSTEMTAATISQGLAGEVPYNITVRALNLAGCGQEQQIYCFTQEGVPMQPKNVTITRINSTAIHVRWNKQTLLELKGLANYTITYTIRGRLTTKQADSGTIMVPWTENSVVITNLRANAAYDVNVGTVTSAGQSESVPVVVDRPSDTTDMIIPVIVGVVVPVLVIAVAIVIVVIIIVFIRRKRHRDEVKFEKSRMLRAFDQPVGIMSGKTERYSADIDKETEAATTKEGPFLTEKAAGDCELIENTVTLPVTFTAAKPSETPNSELQNNGEDLSKPALVDTNSAVTGV